MITGNRLRERRATQPARNPNAPVPAPQLDAVELSRRLQQAEGDLGILRGQLVAMERRAVDAEARAASTHAELLKTLDKPKEQPAPTRGKR